MISDVRLYIDGYQIDLPEDFSFGLTMGCTDAGNIDKTTSDKSTLIKVPATKNNQKRLGFLTDNTVGCSDTEPNAVIISNAVEYYGVVKSYDNSEEDGLIYYNIQIIGSNGDIINQLGEDDVSLLDWDTENEETYNTARINYLETAGLTTIYPLINFGFASTTVATTERCPAFNLFNIFEKIIKYAGYTIRDQSSNILSTFLASDFFNALYYCSPQTFNKSETFRDDNGCYIGSEIKAYNNGDRLAFNIRNNFYKDPLSLWSTVNNEFTSAVNNTYRITYRFSIATASGATYADVNITNGVSTTVVDITGGDVTGATDLYCAAGGKIYMTLSTDGIITLNDFTNIKITQTETINELDTFYLNGCIRDFKMKDFVKEMCKIFCLQMYCDTNQRIVYIDTFDNFYKSVGRDWSTKLDYSKTISLMYLEADKKQTFEYSDDSGDEYLKDYEEQQGTDWRLGKEEYEHMRNELSGEKNIKTEIFSPTLMETCSKIGLTSSKIPKMWADADTEGFSLNFKPRILYFNGVQSLNSGESWTFVSAPARTTWPQFYFYDDVTVNDNSLLFNDIATSNGLVKKYHKNFLKIQDGIVDDNYKVPQVLECYFNLSDTDIAHILNVTTGKSIQYPVYLSDPKLEGFYYIDTIDKYVPGGNSSTKVRLIKMLYKATRLSTTDVTAGDFNSDFNNDFFN